MFSRFREKHCRKQTMSIKIASDVKIDISKGSCMDTALLRSLCNISNKSSCLIVYGKVFSEAYINIISET